MYMNGFCCDVSGKQNKKKDMGGLNMAISLIDQPARMPTTILLMTVGWGWEHAVTIELYISRGDSSHNCYLASQWL
jgi:hypothetical protein